MKVPGETFEFAVVQTRALIRRLNFQIRTSLGNDDAETVHDLRVGIRRLMQAMLVFAPCLYAREIGKAWRRLKRIMAAASLVRNCDIATKLCGKRADRFQKKIQSRRDNGRRKLIVALQHWTRGNYSAGLIDSSATSTARNQEFGRNGIESTARRVLCKTTKRFFRAGNQAAEEAASPRELHEFRIVAKQFRYTLELFLPVCRQSAAVRLNQIKAIQTSLGDVNDCETVRVMLAKWGGRGRINRFLKKREQKNTEEFRQEWTEAFADPENLHRWLRDLQRFRITGRERPRPTPIARAASRAAFLA
jgi:CHAD domain-containing protein